MVNCRGRYFAYLATRNGARYEVSTVKRMGVLSTRGVLAGVGRPVHRLP